MAYEIFFPLDHLLLIHNTGQYRFRLFVSLNFIEHFDRTFRSLDAVSLKKHLAEQTC
jgi:hypothetical protein